MNLFNQIINFLRSLFSFGPLSAAVQPSYVHALEEEAARLRAENRALLNSLLGTAGIPPLDPQTRPAGPMIAPTRRRSWPQIAAEREVAAARHVAVTRPVVSARDAAATPIAAPLREVSASRTQFNHRPAAPAEKPQ